MSYQLSESVSMNDLVSVYINELNTAIVTMYRPPDSTVQSFKWSIMKVNDWIKKIVHKNDGVRIIVNGDFNLGKLEDWNEHIIESTKDRINERIQNKKKIRSECTQMLDLMDFADRWNLIQNIKNPTKDDRILDLVFTNEDIICDINYKKTFQHIRS